MRRGRWTGGGRAGPARGPGTCVRRPALLALAALLLLATAACGSSGSDDDRAGRDVPAVPEPAKAPAPARRPAGRVVPVGGAPEGIVVDAATGLVAVAVRDPAALAVLDRDGAPVRRIALPAPARHLSAGATAGSVLTPVEGRDELLVVDIGSGAIAAPVAVGDNPHDAAPAGGRIFVGDEAADTVHVVEAGRPVRVLPGPVQPGGLAADGDVVAVVGVRGRTFEAFDARSLSSLGTVAAGVGPTHVVASGGRFYVADTQGDQLLVIEVDGGRPRRVARADAEGAPYGIAVDAPRRQLWVTLTASNELVRYDIGGTVPRETGRWPTVGQPNSVGVDTGTGRVHVTGTADGVVQIIDP